MKILEKRFGYLFTTRQWSPTNEAEECKWKDKKASTQKFESSSCISWHHTIPITGWWLTCHTLCHLELYYWFHMFMAHVISHEKARVRLTDNACACGRVWTGELTFIRNRTSEVVYAKNIPRAHWVTQWMTDTLSKVNTRLLSGAELKKKKKNLWNHYRSTQCLVPGVTTFLIQ
jgi:hypothetical protein